MGSVISVVISALGTWLFWLLGYVSGANTFPQPLSEDEEALWVERLQRGDKEARNVLIERNLRLVAHIVKKFDNTNDETDDLISIGTYGLIKAVSTFDPHKGTRLATYAARCIENEILMHLRATKRSRTEVSLYDPIGTDREGNEITLIDVLETEPALDVVEVVGLEMERNRLRSHMSVLDKKESIVIRLRYGLGGRMSKTQREIARMLGISRSYVSRIEKKAVHKLWNAMKQEEQTL